MASSGATIPLDLDESRILLAISMKPDNFIDPIDLLADHSLSDVMRLYRNGMIMVRLRKGWSEGFALTAKGRQSVNRVGFTEDEPKLKVENDLTALRRDFQQFATAMQALARKVEKLEHLENLTELRITEEMLTDDQLATLRDLTKNGVELAIFESQPCVDFATRDTASATIERGGPLW